MAAMKRGLLLFAALVLACSAAVYRVCAHSGARSIAGTIHALAQADPALSARLARAQAPAALAGPRGSVRAGAVEIDLMGTRSVDPVEVGGLAVYPSVLPDTDIAITRLGPNVEWLALVNRIGPRVSLELELASKGHSLRPSSGSVEILDASGAPIAHVEAPVALDADGRRQPVRLSSLGRRMLVEVDPLPGARAPLLVDPFATVSDWISRAERPVLLSTASAWDSLRQRLVVFGGNVQTEAGPLGTITWEWDASGGWTPMPPPAPPGRRWHSMSFDSARGVTVLFGGFGFAYLADTWEWSGTTWTERQPAHSPSARGYQCQAYDPSRGRTVVFGGTDGTAKSDTWEFDGTDWSDVTPAVSPPARMSCAMAFDPTAGKVVMFAGSGEPGALSDSWEWDGSLWSPRASPLGATGWDRAMAFDQARQRLVADQGGTFEWDGTAWLASSPPPCEVTLFYSPTAHRVLAFGNTGPGATSDLFSWSGASWDPLDEGVRPPARAEFAATFDEKLGETVIFGGKSGGSSMNDVWTWNGSRWRKLSFPLEPAGRYGAATVFDSLRQTLVMFGGSGPVGNKSGETWELDTLGAAWSDRTSLLSPSPPPRRFHAMAYDSARHEVVLFGGFSPAMADTWAYDGTSWTDRTPSGLSPSARLLHAMAYDPIRQRVVLFGGNSSLVMGEADTWEWDGAIWSNPVPAHSPPGRRSHAMAWDPDRQRVVMTGGEPDSDSRVWEWDGVDWTVRAVASSPLPRDGLQLAYDTARSRLVMTGGGFIDGLWELGDFRTDGSDCTADWQCASGSCSSVCVTTGGADAGTVQPGPDAATPGPDAAEPGLDAATPGADAAQPGLDAGQPGTDAAQPGLDAGQPGPDASQPGPDASQPGPDASQPGLDAGQPDANAAQPGPDAANAQGADVAVAGRDVGVPGSDASTADLDARSEVALTGWTEGCAAGGAGERSAWPLVLAPLLVAVRRRAGRLTARR